MGGVGCWVGCDDPCEISRNVTDWRAVLLDRSGVFKRIGKWAFAGFDAFMPAVIVAVAAQGSWMWWAQKHQVHEWSIPGYQENYVAQLRLKNANNPELGVASWKDIIARPIENSDNIGSAMFGLFTHKDMAPAWYSPGSVLPLLLMGLGLVYSFNECGLLELYFVSYVGMFLFWSWSFETRFLLPVAPLAFLYAWRGWNLLVRTAQYRRRLDSLVRPRACRSWLPEFDRLGSRCPPPTDAVVRRNVGSGWNGLMWDYSGAAAR